jgi:hypothetical protein
MSLIYINPYSFAVPWTPANIATALWFDASDNSTVFSDAGVTPATPGSSTVWQWNDKSGNGRNIVQGATGNRPSYLSANINGRNVVDCPSLKSMQSTATHSIGTTSVLSAVIKPNSLGINNRDYLTGGTNNDSAHILYQLASPARLNLYSGVNLEGTSVLAANTTSIILGRTNGASSSIRHNGTVLATGNAGSQNWSVNFTVGFSNLGNYVDSIYAEIVIISGASDASTIEKLEGYLAHKWGLTGNLPAGHPYKTDPPTA